MLAAYRDLRNSETDTSELDAHLEQCASCRGVLAQYSLIGKQLRSIPAIEPPPTAQTRLMHTLADEHVRYIQRATPSVYPIPAFLKPYLQEHSQLTQSTDPLVAFSTAETGPLPFLQAPRKQYHRLHVSQLAAIALAAVFLMVVMMSGITTLLVLTHGNAQRAVTRSRGSNSIDQLANVVRVAYTTHTLYNHVVSAVADRTYIYYTAYGDASNDAWMLEQLDRRTGVSTPLLDSASSSPLIVLGSANGWLVWLQFDPAVLPHSGTQWSAYRYFAGNSFHHNSHVVKRTWSLHYLSLSSYSPDLSRGPGIFTPVEPLTLASGTFNQGSSGPDWIYTPVQGIWFLQNTLLVATIDGNNISHLMSYQLDAPKHTTPIEIATASPGHVFTSPTANDDGTEIYWSDEWRTGDGTLDSNIWTQQVSEVPNPFHGRWADHSVTEKQLFRSDGMSFFPEVVNNTLFMLSTAEATNTIQATTGTTPATTPIATSAPTTTPYTPIISWADPGVYIASADRSVRGRLLMLPSNAPSAAAIQVNSGQAWSPQVGSDFVLWQSDQGYQMFDVNTASMVSVDNVLDGAHFLAVNGDTTVWTADNVTNMTNNANPSVTLLAFNWPTKP
jgi:hypothetical protein